MQAIEEQYAQIQRAWKMLGDLSEVELEIPQREQVILDYGGAMDNFLENRGLLSEDIAWLQRALQAAHTLKQPGLLGRFGQDIGWCYRNLDRFHKVLEYLNLALNLRRKYGPQLGETPP